MAGEEDQETSELAAAVGRAVRQARKARDLTLSDLAQEAGLSTAFLSQLENGRSLPGLLTLHRVAKVLGMSAHSLLESGMAPQVDHVPGDEGRILVLTPGATARMLTSVRRRMGPVEVVAEPFTSAAEPLEHAGEEFVYVVDGRIVLEFGSRRFELAARDGLYYPATVRHRWRNDSADPARFLFVSDPPTL